MNTGEWIAAYGRAWVEGDAEAVVALFTDDAVYRSHPFRTPHKGSQGVRDYWTRATSTQEQLELRFGDAVVEGNRAVVEWWAIMRDAGRLDHASRLPPPSLRGRRALRGAPRVLARRGRPA